MQPDVSFIVAAYRAQDSIEAALRSALAQTGVDVEVIVADDCSGDDTADIALALGDPRVKVVRLARNKGPGGARNAAIAHATGRWLAVLDCDDTLDPRRLARMIALGERRGAAAVVDNLAVAETGGARPMFPPDLLRKMPEIGLDAFIRSNRMFRTRFNFGYMKPIFRSRFVAEHALAYDEGLRIGEDFLFLASLMALGGRCAVEPSVGYIYTVRQGSISRVLRADHVDAMLSGDDAFARRYRLEPAAARALAAHRASLVDAQNFLSLVDHLKNRSFGRALATGLANPMALAHLRMPIAVRLARLARPQAGAAL